MQSLSKIQAVLIVALLAFSTSSFAQLTIHLTSLPENTPATDNIYLAGNINGWNPSDTSYKLAQQEDGTYLITINPPIGKIEYKFTRGSWATVEGNAQGQDIENRIVNYAGPSQKKIEVTIESWKEEIATPSTASDNVSILKETFYIPQLDRERKIWVYLPPDYETTDKSYPVLYMHDGQNIFDASTSFSGEWSVDETLNDLFDKGDKGVIVIGIENGGVVRTEEYTVWKHPTYGGGKGEAYIDFIVETLKP